jgi:hypothetical protein
MPYLGINPQYMERYYTGRSVYLGPTTPIRYGVMSTRVDPDTGEIMLTGYREEQGVFPVLPGFFLAWILKGIWNWLTGKLLSIFGIKPEENPLRLDFHMGYMDRSYLPSRYGGNGLGNGYGRNNGNASGVPKGYINNGWENGLTRELYRFD